MKLLDLIPLSQTNKSIIRLVGHKLGYHPEVVETNLELIDTFLKSARDSGKYNTLGDLWADDELKSSIVEFLSATEGVRDSIEATIDVNSTVTCMRCGYSQKLKDMPAVYHHMVEKGYISNDPTHHNVDLPKVVEKPNLMTETVVSHNKSNKKKG